MTRKGITVGLLTVLVLGCGDEPKKRPIGGACTDDGDCSSGLCAAGTCLDPSADDDLDGLVNGLEVSLGSDPQRADTDDDGRPDGEELVSLANVDTDGDGKADVLESAVGDADDDCVTDQYDADDAAPTTDTSPMIPIVCRLVGVCAEGGLSVSCETGEPACVYTGVIGFADPESACDGFDDDCDGDNDDGFADRDADGVADCVDTDWDNDGVADASDVCPEVADPAQADADDNGIGDACASAYGWRFGELPPTIAVDAPFEASGRLVRLASGDGPPPPTLRGGATLASSPALVERALTPVDNAWSLDDLAFDALGEYTLTVSAPGTVTGTSDVIEIVAGPLCRLVASGPATVVAGAPFDVSVTARDAGDHDRVGRAGSATFELGCAGAVPSPGTAPFVDGVATMRGIVATAAGACSVTARVEGDVVVEPCALATTHALTIEPTSADRMELVGMPETVAADAPVSLTLRVLDGYGNLATGYRGTVTLASDDALAVLPAPIALDEAAAGDAEVVVRLRSAGAREVSAADAGTLGARASTLVTAGPATRLVIDAPAEVTAGVAFGVGLSARDAFDNVATAFAGAITLTSDDALATLPSGVVAAAGAATANGLVLRTAGAVTLGASGGGTITGSRQVVVRPGLDRRLALIDPPATIVAGEPFDLRARVEDLFGNLDPAWDGALEVVVDDPAASLPDPVLVVDGEALIEGVALGTAGTWLVTVRDPIETALFATFSLEVEPGPFAALEVSCAPASVAAGETSACAVRAEDALGNLTPTIAGAMAVSVSDAAAVAPATVTLAGGLGALDVAPRTVGVATVEVRSATTPVIVGSDTIEVTSAAVARFVVGLAADTKAGVATAVTVEARDAFDNRVTGFVGVVPLATSDARASLASTLTFAAADLGHAVAPVTFGTRGAQTVTAHAGDPRVGSATTTVRAGAPAALRLDLTGTATAGLAKAFGVTIEDAFGNVADDPDDLYTGGVTFSMTVPAPDLAPTLPAPTTFGDGDLGARELAATWYRAGTWHLHASGAGLAQGEDEVTVVVGPGALDHLVASGPASVDAGEPFDLEVVAEDAWDNPLVAGAAIAVGAVSGCAGPTGGTVPPAAIGPYTCTIAGTVTFGLAASIGDATASVDVTVEPTGPASVVVDLPTEAKAGVAAATTVSVYDTHGNLATGFGGTITITTDDALASAPGSVQAIAGVASFDVVFGTVGTRRVSATLGALSDDDTTVVRAGAPHRLTLTDAPGDAVAGEPRAVEVRILDAYGNTVDDAGAPYEGTVTLSVFGAAPSPAPDLPGALAFDAADAGVMATAATWYDAGTWTLRATGTGLVEPTADLEVTVVPGAAADLVLTGPDATPPGVGFDVFVRVEDAWDNLLTAATSVTIGVPSGCTGPAAATVPPMTVSGFACTEAGPKTFTFTAGALSEELDLDVDPSAPASVELVLPATAKAGVAVTATARARDTFGNVASGYGGNIGIACGDTKATCPSSVTATAGEATFEVTFGSVGSQSVTASIGTFVDSESATVRAGAPHELRLSDAGGSATAGVGKGFTLTIVDAYGNRADDPDDLYLGTVTLSVVAPGPDLTPTLPSPITFVAGDASQRAASATWYRAGAWTLNATGTALGVASDDLAVTVVPGAAHHLDVAGPASVAAGTSFSVDVEVEDEWNNVRTSTASVAITYAAGCTGPSSANVPPKTVSGITCTEAGTKRLTFSTGGAGALTKDLDVPITPLAPASVELVLPATAKAGVAVSATARARDTHGNIAAGYSGAIGVACGDAKATCPSSVTASAGVATFDVTFGTVGSQSVTVTLGAFTDNESATVRAGAPHHLELTDAGGSATAGLGKGFTVTIVDSYGNRATDPADLYLGTVTLSVVAPGPDPAPTLPSPLTFASGDASQRTSTATWYRAGTWTLRATGTSLTGASDDHAITVVPGAAHHLDVTGPASVAAGTSFAIDVEVEDEWDNVRTSSASVSITYPSGCTGPSPATVPPKTVSGVICTESGTKRLTFTAGALTKDLDVPITPLAPASVELVLPATAKAGVAVSATARARDTHGNVAAGYNGAIGISCGDAKATCPSSVTASAGVATFDVTFGTVGSQSVTVTLSTFNDSESATVRAGAPHHLDLTDAGGSATAGVGKGFTVTIVDSYGNRATDPADLYLGTVTLSVVAPGPDLTPTLPSPLTFTSTDASQRASSATWYRAGAWTLRATGTSLTGTTDDLAATVVAGAAHHLDVSGPASVAAAASFSVDVEVEDEWNNVRTSSASVSITYPTGCTGPSPATVPPKTVSGITCTQSGTKRLTFTAGALTKDLDVTITPLAPASVELVLPGTAKAGVAVSATARARDTYGNIAAGYGGTIGITCGDAKATCPSSVTASAGVATFDVTFGTVGSQSVTVTLGAFTDNESASVRAGAPHHLDLTDAGGSATAGVGKGFTVTVVDSYGNRANDPADLYLGTVTMSVVAPGPDLMPSLPSPLTFVASDASQRTSSATWYRAGAWTLRATGTSLALPTNDLGVDVVPGDPDRLDVTGPAQVTAGEDFALTVALVDDWGNPLTLSGGVAVNLPDGCNGPAEVFVPPATITGYACTTAGSQTFVMDHDVYSGQVDVAVTAGEAAELRWLVYPLAGTVALPLRHLGQPLAVEVVDNWGNRVDSTASVGAAIAYNDGRGRLTGTTTVDAVAGVASFDTIAIDRPGRYALVATSAGLTPTPDAGTFEVVHEAPKFAGPPEILIDGGCVSASFALSQPLSAPVDLELRFAWPDPGTGTLTSLPARVGLASPTGLRAVATSPTGVWHEVVWDASADVPRDALPAQYAGLELEIVARIGEASDSATVHVPYDPTAKPATSLIEPPANHDWAKVAPLLWDFDGDGQLDLARYADTINGRVVGFVFDVGGAPAQGFMPLPHGVSVKLFGRARLGDDTFDEVWYVRDDGSELQFQSYRAMGLHDVQIADGWGWFQPCGEGVILDVVAADFDLDGSDELAIACAYGSSGIVIFDADPQGFNISVDVNFAPTTLAVVDWQHDGVPDLVAAHDESVTALVRGDMTFDVVESILLGPAYPIKDMVPFDGDPTEILLPRDGIEDLAIATGDSDVVWLPSRPRYEDGELVSVFGDLAYIDVNDPIDRLAAADVDVDGRTDLLGLTADGGRVTLMRSIRGAQPFLVTTLGAELGARDGFAIGDTDRDGRPEVAVATQSYAALIDFEVPPLCRPDVDDAEPMPDPGDGSGSGWVSGTTWVDVDADGWRDSVQVVTNGDFVTSLAFAPGLGRGHFGPFTTIGPALAQPPVLGDFDGNGLIDSAWVTQDDVMGSLQQGDGTFAPVPLIAGTTCCNGDFAEDLLATDLDGDGLDDILIVTTEHVVWYRNLGGLSFDPEVEIARWDDYAIDDVPVVVLRDINHDGRYELTASLWFGNSIGLCWWVSTDAGWPTDPYECEVIENAADTSIALDATITPERPAILVMVPDIEKDQTEVLFRELPHGLPVIDVTLPGIQILASHFTMRHVDVTGPRSYTLVRTPDQDYGLLYDVADAPAHTFAPLPALSDLDLYRPTVTDVDGDGVVDLVEDYHLYSGRVPSPAGALPPFEVGRAFLTLDTESSGDTVVADLDGNGYLDTARFGFGSQLGGPQDGEGNFGTFAITWTDTPDDLRSSVLEIDAPPTGYFAEVMAEPARMPMPGLAVAYINGLYVYRPALEGLEPDYDGYDFGRPIEAFTVADLDQDGLDDLVGSLGSSGNGADVFVRHQASAGQFAPPVLIEDGFLDAVYPRALATGHLLPPAAGSWPVHIAAAVDDGSSAVIQLYRVPRDFGWVELGGEVLLPLDDFGSGVLGLWAVDLDADRRDDLVAGVRGVSEGGPYTRGVRFFRQRPEGFVAAGGIDFTTDWGEYLLGFADLDRDGLVDLVTYGRVRYGRHKPGTVDFGPPGGDFYMGAALVEWPWRGRPALLGYDRWLPVPDGAGVPGYGP
ncbi:MAG: thrombospondin type 3 repeat-containing protein [Deltaproteobacteria bacterium]|nr:thrombospondin type 3 repeat-containing protein [Deltaproteobacteria bacterium]